MVDECKMSRRHWRDQTKKRRPKYSERNRSHYHFVHRKFPKTLKIFLNMKESRKCKEHSKAHEMCFQNPHDTTAHTAIKGRPISVLSLDPTGVASSVSVFFMSVNFKNRKRRPHFRDFSRNSDLYSNKLPPWFWWELRSSGMLRSVEW
jgi:hypothetical protein